MPAPVIRSLIALVVVGAALFAALTTPARLGLDLRGGTQIVLEARSTDRVEANAENTDRALEVLRKRVDALGVAEPTLARAGEDRIVIELPGVQDPREAAEVVGRTAQLTFHPVTGIAEPLAEGAKDPARAADGSSVMPDEKGVRTRLGPTALDGQSVTDASAQLDTRSVGDWFVTVDFSGGGAAWRDLTAKAACAPPNDPNRRVAIVLDDEVISSPQVDPSVSCDVGIGGGRTQITGRFSAEEAQDLAVLISGGALPLPVEQVELRTVGPTLGAAAIDASIKAALIGLALTGLFISFVYRLMGVLATIALGCYALISYAVLVWLGATLTLPGLAGFVLAIGMAIDANVLVFERAREEYSARRATADRLARGSANDPRSRAERPDAGRDLRSALSTGFNKAWSAILDSNMTTLLAAGLLFFLAAGPVRGFGVTLSIGVLASMVSALVIARALTEWAVRRSFVQKRPGISGIAGTSRIRDRLARSGPDLMGRARIWLALAGAFCLMAVGGIAVRGLDLGVEFTGGRQLEFATVQQVSADRARDAISEAGFPAAVVQTSSEGGEQNITVRTQKLTNEEAASIERALGEAGGGVTKERDELIGPSLGQELRNKALIALGVALLAQLVYLAIRFRWTYGVAAVLAMVHDVLFVVGLFAWLGRPIDGIFLAAALTIIGLSVNDTVVVFDRVRELVRARPGDPLARTVNAAALQTVPRTINTGLGAMFILAALVLLGGDSLGDFALALLVGLVVGTWSSVFTASPLFILLERRFPGVGTARAPRSRPRPDSGPHRERDARPEREPDPADPYAFVDSGQGASTGDGSERRLL